MKHDMKQRLSMAYHGVDADELENPKQKIPPIEQRIKKLERLIESNHPKSKHYVEQLKIYKTLLHPEQKEKRGLWKRVFGG